MVRMIALVAAGAVALSAGGASSAFAEPNENACFGQAFKVFNATVETPTGQLIKPFATTNPEAISSTRGPHKFGCAP
jgi:hypothetical protein